MLSHKFKHNYTVIIPEFAGHMVHKIMILLYIQYTKSFLEVHSKGMKYLNFFFFFFLTSLGDFIELVWMNPNSQITISHTVSEFQSAYTHLLKIQEKPKFITSKTCMACMYINTSD